MKLTIETKSGKFSVECDPGQNVLFAGLSEGLSLPYECATGICGTCRCRIMDGTPELQWQDAPGLARVKIDKNESLMCQLKMRGPCKIRVPGNIEKGGADPKFYSARLIDLEKLTHDVVRFSLQLDVQMSFQPGQFVVVEVDGVPGGRAYSMTNFGTNVDRLDLVIKRIPNGSFSEWLFDGWPDGGELRLFGPLGKATFDPAENMNLLCIAGGSGIAGIMAILKNSIDSNYFSDHKCDLFFGIRKNEDIFFGDELNQLVEMSQNNLSVTVALSNEPIGTELNTRYPSLKFAQGFVHSVASETMKNRYENVCGYIAGPPPMVDAALRVLILEGKLSGENIRYDKFS